MKTIFARLRTFMPSGRLALGLFLLSFLLIDPALANDTGASANPALLGLGAILAIIIQILTFLVLMIMSWGGDLIGTTFLTGTDAMEAVRPMWVFVRNIVNISFVLVLLFLAFANLFSSLSGGQGNWTIKDKLPRVIIALIAVNFSLLIFRVAIDAVHVGTVTILSITDTIMEEKQAFNPGDILNAGVHNTTYARCGPGVEGNDMDVTSGDPNGAGGQCIAFYRYVEEALCAEGADHSDCLVTFTDEVKDNTLITPSNTTEQNIFWAFGTYLQKLELLPILAGKLNTLVGVVNSTIFSAVMAILYAVAWIAVFVALAVRIVVLWFLMIMSPVLIAGQIMGLGSGSMSKVQEKLITNLIMPLKIAAAFALSFVMIATMIEVTPDNYTTILVPGQALQSFWGVGSGPFDIMWQIMTVIVFWTAVWWALDGSDAQFITDKIKDGTKAAGGYVGSWALDKARLPLPGGGKTPSLGALGQLGPALNAASNQFGRQSREDLAALVGGSDRRSRVAAANDFEEFFDSKTGRVNQDSVRGSGVFNGRAILELPKSDVVEAIGKLNDNARNALAGQMGMSGSTPEQLANALTRRSESDIDEIARGARLLAAASSSDNSSSSSNTDAPAANATPAAANSTLNIVDNAVTVGRTSYDPANSTEYTAMVTALKTAGVVLTRDQANAIAAVEGVSQSASQILTDMESTPDSAPAED